MCGKVSGPSDQVSSARAVTSGACPSGPPIRKHRSRPAPRHCSMRCASCSEQLAQRMEQWRGAGRDLCFLIGGPEGHAPEVTARADETWSLGPLTLPHMLVRLVVAEQLYRANALLANHPYHRA